MLKKKGVYYDFQVYYRVKNEGSKLYAVWPGEYRSDLFEIDDIELYGKAYIKGL